MGNTLISISNFDRDQGQFHQHADAQLLPTQIPKLKKDSQVISRKKHERLVVVLYVSGFASYAVCSSLMKLILGIVHKKLFLDIDRKAVLQQGFDPLFLKFDSYR